LHALDDRPGDELDAELACGRARPGERRSVERLRRGAQLLVGSHRRPLLRKYDQLGAVGRRSAREAVGDGEVCGRLGARVELDCGDSQERDSSHRLVTARNSRTPIRK
jgi:hypothetical protein